MRNLYGIHCQQVGRQLTEQVKRAIVDLAPFDRREQTALAEDFSKHPDLTLTEIHLAHSLFPSDAAECSAHLERMGKSKREEAERNSPKNRRQAALEVGRQCGLDAAGQERMLKELGL